MNNKAARKSRFFYARIETHGVPRSQDAGLICLAILRGQADEGFTLHDVAPVDQDSYRRLADEIVAAAIRRRSAARGYFNAPIRNPLNIAVGIAAAVGACSFAIAFALWRWIDLADRNTLPMLSGVAGFAAIGVAAIGWGFSGWVTHRTARSKLTMDVVAARYAQAAFGDAMAAFNKELKTRRIDTALLSQFEQSGDESKRRALQGLRYLLNYFEFISVGVLEGELDERIVAKTLRGNLVYIYDHSAANIGELRRINPKTLEHFVTLRRHYRDL